MELIIYLDSLHDEPLQTEALHRGLVVVIESAENSDDKICSKVSLISGKLTRQIIRKNDATRTNNCFLFMHGNLDESSVT